MAYSLWSVCRVRLRTVSLPRLFGARSAPYYRVYPKTVRRGVAWIERSGIQEAGVFPDSALLHLGYVVVSLHSFSVGTVLLAAFLAQPSLLITRSSLLITAPRHHFPG